MAFDIESVRKQLPGRELHYFESIDTTMRQAAALAEYGAESGTVVIADEQTAGQGRHGHAWASEKGLGLYASILLRPALRRESAPTLTMALGLATAEAITTVAGVACDLRWPNDILIGERKAAGILTHLLESSVVAGIGINVNHEKFAGELASEATSLRIAAGSPQSRERLLIELLPTVDRYVEILEDRGASAILDLFSRRSTYASGKRVVMRQGRHGTTAGLNESGFLVVRMDDGSDEIILAEVCVLLALDAGNTNIKIGAFEKGKLIWDGRLRTVHEQTADELGVLMRNLFELAGLDSARVEAMIIASVVPPIDSSLAMMAWRYFKTEAVFVTHETDTGLTLCYDDPREVGADRLVDAAAAFKKYGGPCIVVDLGTAITFNAVSAKAEYLGGIIAAGIGISIDALFARTARLPRVDFREPEKLIGTNTVGSMQSGLYYGALGMIDGVIERLLNELGPDTKVIATGGQARLIARSSRYLNMIDENLTLEGLEMIWRRGRERS